MAYYTYKIVEFIILSAGFAAVMFSAADSWRAYRSPTGRDTGGMGLQDNLQALVCFVLVLLIVSIIFSAIDKMIGA